jgi:phage shock protein PspC (stress-responsive transcriptional regulator)
MTKTTKVSLAGMAFTLEEEAYLKFEQYLNSIRLRLQGTNECEDVIRDIEERASELFHEMLNGSDVVTIDMVAKVIETIGNPEEFLDDAGANSNGDETKSSSEPIHKRLYRDSENAIFAGICSGLSEYFRVDPVVFRIIFVALTLAHGLGIILYIALWIAIPRASTPKQRLEMKGEPINLSNIERDIKREYEEVRKNLAKQEVAEKGISVFSKILVMAVKVFGVFARILGVFIAILLIVIGVLALIAIIGSLFFSGLALSILFPQLGELSITEFLSTTFDLASVAWVLVPVFIILAIPLLSLIYLGIRILFNFKSRNSVVSSVGAIVWVVALVVFIGALVLQIRSLTIREAVVEKYSFTLPDNSKTLYLSSMPMLDSSFISPKEAISVDDYWVGVEENGMTIFGRPKITLGKSETDQYELIIEKKSRGASKASAIQNAMNVKYSQGLKDTAIIFNPYFSLPKGGKWRIQEVNIRLNIPHGNKVFISNELKEMLHQNQEICLCWPDELVGKTWIMRQDRMVEY